MTDIKEKLKYILIIVILLAFISFIVLYYYLNKPKEEIKEVVEEVKKEEPIKEEKTYYFVDIKGAVNNEGVYKLEQNSRVIDAINLSGGLKDNADTSTINLSKKIKDEMLIIVYTKDEINEYKNKTISTKEINKKLEEKIITIDENNDANIKEKKTNKEEKELVNINTCSKEDLLSISGVGESKAEAIIKYREENKEFKTIEDIKNVTGIGESLFEKIKEYIKV